MNKRAIGIVRVSQREDDSGHSPEVQVRAMLKLAEEHGWTLHPDDILDENVDTNGRVRNVSGGWDLCDRPKLRYALDEIERALAGVVMAERLDRLFRDFDHQRAFVRRVESAGGQLVTVTQGAISHATAEAEMMANMNGVVAHYVKRTAQERSWNAVEVAIEQGKVPWSQTAPGYLRNPDSTLRPDPDVRSVVEQAFRMRRDWATVEEVRDHLRRHGIVRSYHGTTHLLRDRIYLGEIHFGTHTPNLKAHDAIISRDLFDAVQGKTVSRGRKAKSERLLARLGVLRCGSCGARMVVGTSHHGRYWIYRCPPTGHCAQHMTISATIAEDAVVVAMKRWHSELAGRASVDLDLTEAEATYGRAQEALEQAIKMLCGFEAEEATRLRLAELKQARDDARRRYEELSSKREAGMLAISVAEWDDLTMAEQRELIKLALDRVQVNPGRGPERIRIVPASETVTV